MTTFDEAIAAPRARRARLRWEYVFACLFWGVALGLFVFWIFVWAKGGEDQASGFVWQSSAQVFQNVRRITALLPGSDRDPAARAFAVPRAAYRLRPPDDLAPLERPRRALARARARRLQRLGLREGRPGVRAG